MLHPDSAHPSSSPDNFATLNKAYTLLSQSSTRSNYVSTGHGWTRPESSSNDSLEAMMRAEVIRRARAGAGNRFGDAGRGAWGGYGGTDQWRAYGDAGFHGDVTTEPTYMSHPRFFGVLMVLVSLPRQKP